MTGIEIVSIGATTLGAQTSFCQHITPDGPIPLSETHVHGFYKQKNRLANANGVLDSKTPVEGLLAFIEFLRRETDNWNHELYLVSQFILVCLLHGGSSSTMWKLGYS